MADDLGALRYTFGVITDTHVNQGEDDCNSPFQVNQLSNARMRYVVRSLNDRDLAFVVNVGDLVHPVPAIPNLYKRAAEQFLGQVKHLRHPLYLAPGNHDVGDKPNDWAPAAGICDAYLALWEEYFGAQFQSFDHAGDHFVIINAEIINSGLKSEAEQRTWLEADLAANKGKRIFMFSHYPPYFAKADEEENYDNIGEPGRSWMLNLLVENDVEALYIGHVHNFWYNRHGPTDCYLLPSTSFVRQDYSEMYRAQPLPDAQAGRNDKPKLGYFIVHVYEKGHVIEIVRTYGATVAPDAPVVAPPERVAPVHPRLNRHGRFGFDMRQNWMEVVEIPPSGGLDEFDRKEVRNDYPLMALWEMGIRKVRVPLRDLLVPDVRERMRMLTRHGHEFTLFTFGAPSARDRKLIDAYRDVFSAWEIGFNMEVFDRDVAGIGAAAKGTDLPVYLSRLRSIDELRAEAGRYYHAINQGFLASDEAQMKGLLAHPDLAGGIDGFVFRLMDDRSAWAATEEASRLARAMGVKASVHLRMFGANPGESREDDPWAANRLAEGALAANTFADVSVYSDTFIDNDRGYHVRNGVLDKRNNPRDGFHVVRHLLGALDAYREIAPGGMVEKDGLRALTVKADGKDLTLVMKPAVGAGPDVGDLGAVFGGKPPKGRAVDLLSGEIVPADKLASLPALFLP
jgi:3',5'-cyclic AMP phosphodiesterase CpdA